MKLSELSRENKAKIMSSIAMAIKSLMGDENLFFMLVVDDTGHMAHTCNINRDAIPRLLREYADQMEKKGAHVP